MMTFCIFCYESFVSTVHVFRQLHYVCIERVLASVADPDPPDPHVFGPPGSGSGSTSQRYGSSCKNSKKNLDSYYLAIFFDFLSLKHDVNVPSKSIKQKKLC